MIRRFSVQELNYLSYTKEIWCIGCGKRLNDMLKIYRKEIFVEKISVLMDNNCKLWGVSKQVGKKNVTICGTNIIKEKGNKHVLVIITSDNDKAIYKKIAKDIKVRKMIICLYPIYYSTLTKRIMHAFCYLPLKRQLLFYVGKEPHENADAIVQYLKSEYQGEKYRIVYLTDSEEKGEEGAIYLSKKSICYKSSIWQIIRYCWFYSKSAFIFYENEFLTKVRSEQKLIYLNHGTIPLKKVSDVLKQPQQVDYALCPSKDCAELYYAQYGIPIEKQLYIMPPRVWNLFQKQQVLCNWINIKNKQVIIWLPTFRQLKGTQRKDSFLENPFQILEENGFQKLDKKLENNNQLLLIKRHPREKKKFKIPDICKNIILLTEEILERKGLILQDILGETAALITDYSGIAFEYMLLERPICYVITDIKEYFRGFAAEQPFDYMPGLKVRTLSELLSFLDTVRLGIDEYQEERHSLVKKLFGKNRCQNGAKELIAVLDRKWEMK